MKSRHWVIPSSLALLVIGSLHALTLASGIPDHLSISTLTIETTSGQRHEFKIYEAVTPEDRSRGLMYVDALGAAEGMLFDSDSVGYMSVWMKNTAIPLDVLFVRADGTISSIAADMTPYSRKAVPSRERVRAMLEINAGTCERLGIAEGDRVHHPVFKD